MDILKKLEDIFRDVFDDEDIVLTNETTANDIEDWDSLAQINLLVAIKKEFKINFDLEEDRGVVITNIIDITKIRRELEE